MVQQTKIVVVSRWNTFCYYHVNIWKYARFITEFMMIVHTFEFKQDKIHNTVMFVW